MDKRDLKVGDVVQIAPNNVNFAACFMVVTEPKVWGAQGYILCPAANGPRQAFFRCKFEDMEFIGHAEWSIGDREAEADA